MIIITFSCIHGVGVGVYDTINNNNYIYWCNNYGDIYTFVMTEEILEQVTDSGFIVKNNLTRSLSQTEQEYYCFKLQ